MEQGLRVLAPGETESPDGVSQMPARAKPDSIREACLDEAFDRLRFNTSAV
jgi:hypothetical protein